MEGKVSFSAVHTPSYDEFTTVTLTARLNQVGGGGASCIWGDFTVAEARAFAAEIERSCVIVENDK